MPCSKAGQPVPEAAEHPGTSTPLDRLSTGPFPTRISAGACVSVLSHQAFLFLFILALLLAFTQCSSWAPPWASSWAAPWASSWTSSWASFSSVSCHPSCRSAGSCWSPVGAGFGWSPVGAGSGSHLRFLVSVAPRGFPLVSGGSGPASPVTSSPNLWRRCQSFCLAHFWGFVSN